MSEKSDDTSPFPRCAHDDDDDRGWKSPLPLSMEEAIQTIEDALDQLNDLCPEFQIVPSTPESKCHETPAASVSQALEVWKARRQVCDKIMETSDWTGAYPIDKLIQQHNAELNRKWGQDRVYLGHADT
jgi:hypothetical protein